MYSIASRYFTFLQHELVLHRISLAIIGILLPLFVAFYAFSGAVPAAVSVLLASLHLAAFVYHIIARRASIRQSFAQSVTAALSGYLAGADRETLAQDLAKVRGKPVAWLMPTRSARMHNALREENGN